MAEQEQTKQPLCPVKIHFPYNTIFMIINFVFLIVTAFWFVTISSVHFRTRDCNKYISTPGIFVSFSLLAMSLIGFYASYFRSDCLFRIYFFLLFLWMFALVSASTFFGLLNKETNPKIFPGTQIKEYKLDEYSGWVRRLVVKEDEWYRIKRCLRSDNVCNELSSTKNMSISAFYNMDLNPIKSGCCKPPLSCGFGYVKPNFWNTTTKYNFTEADCRKWNNDVETYCFDCDSCRAGIIASLNGTTQSIGSSIAQIMSTFFVGYLGWFSWLKSLREVQISESRNTKNLNF
ncbi:PREDICTED: tetraspanin-13 [Tarenaya hassleriana]|uniref:tetraspanin-13 n=1 Tax=Tarenaya hassleriana TaxID=28532 RepID=UPI00053C2306|nr:PREDICTED: tetraspanin-13 [Tarenaya hassleriana]